MMSSQEPKVAVITLNYNQVEYTVDCIKSLLKSEYSNFEIILVDNGSTEQNFRLLQNELPKDRRINTKRIEINQGYVGGINFGLKIANLSRYEYFLIMNNDTLIDKIAIKELVNSSERNKDNAILTGKVYHYDKPNILQVIGQKCRDSKKLDYPPIISNYYEEDLGQYDLEEERGMIDDIFWLLPKKIFDDIGYYSDYFFLYGEQNDYALKAIKKGYRLIYNPKAKLWHKGGVTTSESNKNSPRIVYWTSFGTLKLSELHLSRSEGIKFRREWIFKNIIKKTILFFKGRIAFKNIIAFIHSIFHFYIWRKRKCADDGYNPY